MLSPKIEIDDAELRRFERALGVLVQRAGGELSRVIRKVSFDLMRDIMRSTPVDTGRARAAWSVLFDAVGISAPSIGGTPAGVAQGKREGVATVNLPTMAQIPTGLTGPKPQDLPFVQVVNNVKYIIPLEFGWSRQARLGMVRKEIRRHGRELVTQLKVA